MNENLKKVFETIEADPAFAEKMSQCKSPEEAYELAKTVADGFTLDEMKEASETLFKDLNIGGEEITEEDLELVSGGLSKGATIAIAGGVGGGGVLVSILVGLAG